MRVGDVGAGHANQVDLALANGVSGGGHIVDLRRVQHGQTGAGLHQTGEVEMRRRRHAVQRDHLAERSVGDDAAADDIDEIDETLIGEALQRRHGVVEVQAVGSKLVENHSHADDVGVTHPLSDGPQHLHREAQAILERAAVLVGAQVGSGGEKLIEEMPIGLDFNSVHATRLHPFRSVGVVTHDALDVPTLGFLGVGAVCWLAQSRRCHHWQPVVLPPPGPATEVADLDHRRAVVLVDLVGHPVNPRHDRIVKRVQVPEGWRAVRADHRGAGRHRHRQPALRLLHVIRPVPVFGHAIFAVGRLVRRAEHAVLQA